MISSKTKTCLHTYLEDTRVSQLLSDARMVELAGHQLVVRLNAPHVVGVRLVNHAEQIAEIFLELSSERLCSDCAARTPGAPAAVSALSF